MSARVVSTRVIAAVAVTLFAGSMIAALALPAVSTVMATGSPWNREKGPG
ncbi:hypothetical protein [Nonomuraea turkmeniaca]|nr:hypothetical protein [Nonomuraea turkmeniaca]